MKKKKIELPAEIKVGKHKNSGPNLVHLPPAVKRREWNKMHPELREAITEGIRIFGKPTGVYYERK